MLNHPTRDQQRVDETYKVFSFGEKVANTLALIAPVGVTRLEK